MAEKPLPCPVLLRQLLRYEPETGKLFWRERPREWFKSDRAFNAINSRDAGKETFITLHHEGYFRGMIYGRVYAAHRVIWAMQYGYWPDQVDHINGDRQDNRLVNLREVSHLENMQNKRLYSNNKSGHAGVFFNKDRGKWQAHIRVDGERVHLGMFESRDEAITARKEASVRHGFHENHGA